MLFDGWNRNIGRYDGLQLTRDVVMTELCSVCEMIRDVAYSSTGKFGNGRLFSPTRENVRAYVELRGFSPCFVMYC